MHYPATCCVVVSLCPLCYLAPISHSTNRNPTTIPPSLFSALLPQISFPIHPVVISPSLCIASIHCIMLYVSF
ncbi:hypothetical protein F5B17DRAFT_387907 [Nemania serpens]|nr:hypothetical protein F5B17DRAFT_387907 [Nemania serpens]